MGLEPTTDDSPAPAFEAGSSSSRMTSVCRSTGCQPVSVFEMRLQARTGWQPVLRKAAVAGIEPASGRLTAACPYQHEHHRNVSAGAAVFPHSLSHQLPSSKERPAGVEPALPPWQGGRLPLHHGRSRLLTMLRAPDQPAVGARTRTHVAALRVPCPCR